MSDQLSEQGDGMNVLFLSIGGLSDIEAKGLYPDLLRQFRNNGHNVYVVCTREKRLNMPTEYIIENGVHFLRIRIGNITKVNVVEKGISTLLIGNSYLREIKKRMKQVNFDLVMYSTPPITFEKVIRYIKNRDGAGSYLLLKDIFPQNAVDIGILKKTGIKGILYTYFKSKERKLYKLSDYIGCMSKANVDYILKQNPWISPDIVEVCPNSIEPVIIEKNEKISRRVKRKYNIPIDKVTFLYGGNLGKPQGIDFLIECLDSNKTNNDIYFIIAGSGTEFNKLNEYFINEKPQNAQLFKRLPKAEYDILANSCDVGLIFLDKRFTIPNFPSRLLSYLQASIPVLAATDANTDIGKVIEKGGFGYWCESNNIEEFNKKIQLLCDADLRKEMGLSARKYLENNFTAKHSYEIIISHFK